jgi:hypothetical protein
MANLRRQRPSHLVPGLPLVALRTLAVQGSIRPLTWLTSLRFLSDARFCTILRPTTCPANGGTWPLMPDPRQPQTLSPVLARSDPLDPSLVLQVPANGKL